MHPSQKDIDRLCELRRGRRQQRASAAAILCFPPPLSPPKIFPIPPLEGHEVEVEALSSLPLNYISLSRKAPLQPWAPTSQHSRNLRRGQLQQETGKRTAGIHPPDRSASFHGKTTTAHQMMRRPKTQPDLLAPAPGGRKIASPVELWRLGGGGGGGGDEQQITRRVPSKVLVNVNVQRSLGALQVMASTNWTVDQLVAAAIKQYIKEGRRPPLPSTDPSAFCLHYSQFSLQCLDPKEKLIGLGSRNFFLCPKPTTASNCFSALSSSTTAASASVQAPNEASTTTSSSSTLPTASSSCSKEAADKASKISIPWLRFMDFLL